MEQPTESSTWQTRIALPIATGLGSGFLPISGTAGTLAIFLLHLLVFPRFFERDNWIVGLLVIFTVSGISIVTASIAEKYYHRKDDGRVVIDEWAGYLVTVFLLPGTWKWLLAGFFVFRFFDIIKPPPARGLQALHGGLGITIDDLIAGVYGCILLHIIRLTVLYFG